MFVQIFETGTELSEFAAAQITAALAGVKDPTLGVATGSTPLALYACLRRLHAQGKFSLAHAQAFALDEYVGLETTHPESYRSVLLRELVAGGATGLQAKHLHTPAGWGVDALQAALDYERLLSSTDGVTLQILGIGSNGHIGFNEPGTALDSVTHVVKLAASTRADNARFFADRLELVPEFAITQGLQTILRARKLLLLATGSAKAAAVAAALEGAVATACPASVLQQHPDVVVLLDKAATADLSADFLRRHGY